MGYKLRAWGETCDVYASRATYRDNDNLAVCLNEADGMPYATLTVNLGIKLPQNLAFVDTNNCPWAERFLRETGIATPMGQTASSGWCTYPLYKFDMSKLAEGRD